MNTERITSDLEVSALFTLISKGEMSESDAEEIIRLARVNQGQWCRIGDNGPRVRFDGFWTVEIPQKIS